MMKIQDTGVQNNVREMSEAMQKASGNQAGLEGEKSRKTIFAGDLNLDPIAEKRKEAQEKAMKIMEDAWARDREIDDSITKRKNHYEEMKAEMAQNNTEIVRLQSEEDALKETYQIDPESQEQKDLELLEKQQDIDKGLIDPNELTEEEKQRLEELNNQPQTEYQERALALHDRAGVFKVRRDEAETKMKDDLADIRGIKQGRLQQKRTPMQEAQAAIEEIYEEASKEIISMIKEDGIEHIDEVQEENEEKAEETGEKKKEEEERLEEVKEQRMIQEALIEGTKEALEQAEAEVRRRENEAPVMDIDDMIEYNGSSGSSTDVSKSLDELKFSMNLLEADLKGIKVDEEV